MIINDKEITQMQKEWKRTLPSSKATEYVALSQLLEMKLQSLSSEESLNDQITIPNDFSDDAISDVFQVFHLKVISTDPIGKKFKLVTFKE